MVEDVKSKRVGALPNVKFSSLVSPGRIQSDFYFVAASQNEYRSSQSDRIGLIVPLEQLLLPYVRNGEVGVPKN